MRPLVASGEKPKVFFPLTEIMLLKFKYYSNIDNILVQNSNLFFSQFDSPTSLGNLLWLIKNVYQEGKDVYTKSMHYA